MNKAVILSLSAVCLASLAKPAEDPSKHDRLWWLNLQAPTQQGFYGTFVKVENGYVVIKTRTGETKRIIAGNLGWTDLAYVQRQQTRFPKTIKTRKEPKDGKPLIDLDASKLATAKISKWPNKGSIGGAFHAANMSLPVVKMAGRKAVQFYYGPWNLPLEFPTMIADFKAPASIAKNGPFTVSAWLYNPSALGVDMTRETVLSWHNIAGDDGTDIGYGQEGRYAHEKSQLGGAYLGAYGGFGFPDAVWPMLNQWHHIVYVFDGKRDGSIRFYIDGKLAADRQFRRSILLKPATEIGKSGATLRADLYLRDKEPVPVTVLVGEVDNHFLRGKESWTVVKDLGKQGPGLISAKIDGLKPGKRYFYRFYAVAPNETRWSDGAGSFVTATDKTPGKNLPKDNDKLMFLGSSFGSLWDWASRPRFTYTGGISSLKLFNRALSNNQVLALCKQEGAKPSKGSLSRLTGEGQGGGVARQEREQLSAYFQPEFDGLVSEPFPSTIVQSGAYGKLMEAVGQVVISGPDCPDEAMRRCSYTMSKMLYKRPDIVEAMNAMNCGATLDYPGMKQGAWSEMITQAYGNIMTFEVDPTFYWGINIMFHEMGHQFHMYGAEMVEDNYRKRLFDIFWKNKLDQRWIGDYGGFNIWEYMAVVASQFCSDGDPEDYIIKRETFRRIDPPMFYFLEKYWPGDKMVELLAGEGMSVDVAGKVRSWKNQGGLEYWGRFGLAQHERSVGSFIASGKPKVATVAGLSAVSLTPSDSLKWNCKTRECLIGNHAWSVEGWFQAEPGAKGQIMRWGNATDFVQLNWGSLSLGKKRSLKWNQTPSDGKWHHVVVAYTGGGLADKFGLIKVYIDGFLNSSLSAKLNLPTGQSITVGGGFSGSINQLRIFDYELSGLQLKGYYDEQKTAFNGEMPMAGGRLLVNLDATKLAPRPVFQSRPLYPESTGKKWLRSWANYGTLGGKLVNDAKGGDSQPMPEMVDGLDAISFDGNDRMVSSFPLAGQPIGAIDGWVYRSQTDEGSAILQWGTLKLSSKQLPINKWSHVTLNMAKNDAPISVDSKQVDKVSATLGRADRLNIGAEWDGQKWVNGFKGSISQLRVHTAPLTDQLIQANDEDSMLRMAAHPSPAAGEKIVATRPMKLSWSEGLNDRNSVYDVYFGTSYAKVQNADRKSKAYQGCFAPGKPDRLRPIEEVEDIPVQPQFSPKLEPGKTYYWRIDTLHSGLPAFVGKVWSFSTAKGEVVSLDANDLSNGQIKQWTNKGSAKGSFKAKNWSDVAAPKAYTMDGRKGVDFTSGKCLAGLEPFRLGTADGFTVSTWAYSIQVFDNATLLTIIDMRFNNARNPKSGAFQLGDQKMAFKGDFVKVTEQQHNAPLVNYWNHLAWVYSAKKKTLSLYVNGRLNNSMKVDIPRLVVGKLAVGAAMNPDGKWFDSYPGLIDHLQIYTIELGAHEVRALAAGRKALTVPFYQFDSKDVKEGLVAKWLNSGPAIATLQLPETKPNLPVAETIEGKKAVTFSGDGSFLMSDIATPKETTGMKPLTVEIEAFNPHIEQAETMFSLVPRKAFVPSYLEDWMKRAMEIRYGADAVFTGADSRTLAWDENKAPEAGKWHKIAFVYDGQLHGWGRIFVDGKLVKEKGWYTLSPLAGLPMVVGSAWNTSYGPQEGFSGSIASVKVFDYAKTADELAK